MSAGRWFFSSWFEGGLWSSLVKDVAHFKKFAWVQEENEEMIKWQFHGGLADKTNHITLKKSELKEPETVAGRGLCLALFSVRHLLLATVRDTAQRGPWTESAQPFLCSTSQPDIAHCETPLIACILLWTMIEDFFSLDRAWSKISIPPTESQWKREATLTPSRDTSSQGKLCYFHHLYLPNMY